MEKELLRKYFKNECTPAEARKVLAWINLQKNREETLSSIEKDWNEFDAGKFVTPQNFDSLAEKMKSGIARKSVKEKAVNRRMYYWMSAASVALIAVLAIYFISPEENTNLYSEQVTLKGERTTIYLSDGSTILLDADSKLVYPSKLTDENRDLYLEGQAYFTLASSKPITINSNHVTTIAQATSFSVSAFPEKNKIVVAVEEGTAEVRTGEEKLMPLIKLRMPKTLPLTKIQKPTVVKEKEYLAYSKDGDTIEKELYLDEKQVFGWKDGIIYFKDANPQEITTTLERWYGVDICFEREVKGVFSGEFSNQKVEDVLSSIGKTSHIKFKMGDQCI